MNNVKEVNLPCKDTELNIVFIAKENNEYFVLTKTNYKGKDKEYKSNDHKTINEYTFTFPTMKEMYEDKIDEHSLIIAKELFNKDLSCFYKGHILTDLDKQRYIYKSCRTKNYYKDTIRKPKKVKLYFICFGQKKKDKASK